MTGNRGISRFETLIIVTSLLTLAAVLWPQFLQIRSEQFEQRLVTDLEFVRGALKEYQRDHAGLSAGLTSDNEVSDRLFQRQLCGKTAQDGSLRTDGKFGPYLLVGVPPNPFNGKTAVRICLQERLPLPDETTGWSYHPASGQFVPNLRGNSPSGTLFTKL
jgi:hypothetical protein